MCRWKQTMTSKKGPSTLAAVRSALDDMEAEEVKNSILFGCTIFISFLVCQTQFCLLQIVWDPYRYVRNSSRPLQSIAFFNGMLSCHEIEEVYMSSRVLRQFGCLQTVPIRPVRLVRAPGGTKPLNYVPAQFAWQADYFTQWQEHVVGQNERQEVGEMWDCSNDYMAYYARIGMPKLLNPDLARPTVVASLAPLPPPNVLYATVQKLVRN